MLPTRRACGYGPTGVAARGVRRARAVERLVRVPRVVDDRGVRGAVVGDGRDPVVVSPGHSPGCTVPAFGCAVGFDDDPGFFRSYCYSTQTTFRGSAIIK